jgi:hypothetical protein
MPTLIASEPVTLKGGHVVSLSALQLLWALEARGLQIEREADKLAVGPRDQLTTDDREQIKAHRDELLQLVDYTERRGWEM